MRTVDIGFFDVEMPADALERLGRAFPLGVRQLPTHDDADFSVCISFADMHVHAVIQKACSALGFCSVHTQCAWREVGLA